MTEVASELLQSYNLGYIETHQHQKALAYVIRTVAQNLKSSSDGSPTEEWSKGYVVGVSAVKQELFRIAEQLDDKII